MAIKSNEVIAEKATRDRSLAKDRINPHKNSKPLCREGDKNNIQCHLVNQKTKARKHLNEKTCAHRWRDAKELSFETDSYNGEKTSTSRNNKHHK